ncbi:hypothetical protein THRCLA_09069 [Thraustotheca clavata]|uniref:Secreted protein n=1 Tax=Thraustotheca clavata TaxID=74557 RepID=A0A1V9YZZ4_9STRA|nr:hypothetical protein THRCLA_09069 [Thraustotheca clavata]
MRVCTLLALTTALVAGADISLRGLEQSNVTTVPVTTVPVTTVPVPTTVTAPPTQTPAPTTSPAPPTTAPAPTTSPATSTVPPTSTPQTTTATVTPKPETSQPAATQATSTPQPTNAATTSGSSSKSSTTKPSTSKPTTPTPASDGSGSSMSTGVVIGIVAGIICGIAIIAALVYICLRKRQEEDDDPISPNDFGKQDTTPVYENKPLTPVQRTAPIPPAQPVTTSNSFTANNGNYTYNNDYAAAPQYATTNNVSYQQPTAPAAIAAAAAAHQNAYAEMYGNASPQEFYDRQSESSSSEPSNHSGKNAWMQAMQKPDYDSDGVDIDRMDTNSYNSAKFDDNHSDISRDSSFLSRDESLGSSLDDYPSHHGTKQERGSYEL